MRGDFTGMEGPQPVPADFNYDLWLGPAPWTPYTPARCHFNFRWILDYGEGYISDNGVHFVDLAMWGIGADDTGPLHVEGKATFPSTGIYDAPTDFEITYRFTNGVRLVLGSAEEFGVKFEGSEGWLHSNGFSLTAFPEKIRSAVIGPNEIRLRPSPGHHTDFLDCVINRRLPAAHAEIGQRTATVCHIGYIATRLGRPLQWDPQRELFPADPDANRLLTRTPHEPWML